MTPDDLEWIFSVYLPHRLSELALQYGLSADQREELEGWVRERLAHNDFELLGGHATPPRKAIYIVLERLLRSRMNQYAVPRARAEPAAKQGLFVRAKCADVEVGTASFDRAVGLAHTILVPSKGYTIVAPFARTMGAWLAVRHYWTPSHGDVADMVSDAWRGERLSLEDRLYRELSVAHVIIAERHNRFGNAPLIELVADFRPEYARVAAVVPLGGMGSGGRRGLSA